MPGLIVGGSTVDSSPLYTIDYRWDGNIAKNEFDVLRVQGETGEAAPDRVDGWVGTTFVRG